MQISSAFTGLYNPPTAIANVSKQSSTTQSSAAAAPSTGNDPTQAFLNYMKETPAQKLEDAWLAAHHLTRKDLDAMSPEKRQAIEKQMAEDIKRQIKQAAENKSAGKTDILV